jgi:GTP pyrophosphokinase
MIVRGRDFSDIYDLVGIRILVEDDRDCYAVLGVLHSRWNPVPGRFKDFVAMPKFNMYQSLHTTVIGLEGKPVELQIRTFSMHRRAEYGVAAHWKYKEDVRSGRDTDQQSGRRSGGHGLGAAAARLAARDRGPGEFLESPAVRDQLLRGLRLHAARRRERASGRSSPVDFAYAIHTEVGHHTIGARVNGRPRAAGVHARQRRRRRGVHLQGAERRAEPRLARASCSLRVLAARSATGSPRSA